MFKELFGSGSSTTLLESAFGDVTTMLQQSARMLDHALAALLDNQPLEVDLQSMDDVVDNSERMVRRTVLEHMTVNPKQDLVASLILVSIVQDGERIGDFARGLTDLIPLAKSPRQGAAADELKALAAEVRPNFELCERAFRKDEAEVATAVVACHTSVKPRLGAYIARLCDSDLSPDMAIVYASAARILSRISAHLSNIASTVTQPYDRIRHGDEDA